MFSALFLFGTCAFSATYKVELTAPSPLKKLLSEHLDLFRYLDRDDIDADQIEFMVAGAPAQVERLAATEGYFSPKTEVSVDRSAATPVVRINVEPGARTVVADNNIAVTGVAQEASPEQVRKVIESWPLEVGEPFEQAEWTAAKQAGLSILQQRRYAAARIADSKAQVNADKNTAELGVTYDSGPIFTFGPTQIEGTNRYPKSIIENVNPLKVGEEYSVERLLEFQRQIQRTPYFSNAVVGIEEDPAQAKLAPVKVRVTEFPRYYVRANLGYTTDTGFRTSGLFSDYNVFNRAWVFNGQARLEQRLQSASAELIMPPAPGAWVNSLQSTIERTTLEGVDLRTRRIGVRRARVTDKRETGYALTYYNDQLQLTDAGGRPSGAELPSEIVVEPGNHQALVASVEQTRRMVDNPIFPRKGRIISGEVGVAVKGLLTDQTFLRLYGRLREYIPIGERDLVILRAEVGAVFSEGDNTAIPASLLFRAGGTESVRGYDFQSIGKEINGRIFPTRYLTTGGAEYVHWLTEQWGGAVFYDVGLATDSWEDKSWFHAVGIGARYKSPVGRINVDLAYGFQANKIRPHLSLGIAF